METSVTSTAYNKGGPVARHLIDESLKAQLSQVFANLNSETTLLYDESDSEKFEEFKLFLEDMASTSEFIKTQPSGHKSPHPYFKILFGTEDPEVSFLGIPGGHELSSLVLAILNGNSQGKLPDAGIMARIRNLKGPGLLKTFVSLSCENCPNVVQALNLIAINNPSIGHQMVDGAFVQEEIEQRKIKGVPTVVAEDHILSVGQSNLGELLAQLEEHFGKQSENSAESLSLGDFDVAVIGAGPAGVASAIYTARKGLKTAIITDRMGGQLQDTKGIENFTSVSYTEGPKLSSDLHQHMKDYDISVFENRRVAMLSDGSENPSDKDTGAHPGPGATESLNPVQSSGVIGQRQVVLTSGEQLGARSVIVTTGAKWRELGVPGEKDYLGRGVAFCPHCDGPIYKGKDIAVIGGGNSGVEAAIDLAGIVKSVTLLEFGDSLKADSVLVDKLKTLPNAKIIVSAQTTEVVGDGDVVTALKYKNRETDEISELPLEGVFVQIGLVPNSQFLKGLVPTNPYGEIIVDDKCRTEVSGVYAAGDVTNVPYKQIVVAMGEGAKAGLSASEDLMIGA